MGPFDDITPTGSQQKVALQDTHNTV